MPWNEPKTPFMQNLHNRHSRRENPFRKMLLDLERAYALPCGFHYCSPGTDCARSARLSEQPET